MDRIRVLRYVRLIRGSVIKIRPERGQSRCRECSMDKVKLCSSFCLLIIAICWNSREYTKRTGGKKRVISYYLITFTFNLILYTIIPFLQINIRRIQFSSKVRQIVLKLGKNLNPHNSEDNDFLSMNQRSLEARNLPLWNAFSLIPIRLPVPEISSCKGNGNFLIVYYLPPCRLFGPLARASPHWPIPNSRQATDAIPGRA